MGHSLASDLVASTNSSNQLITTSLSTSPNSHGSGGCRDPSLLLTAGKRRMLKELSSAAGLSLLVATLFYLLAALLFQRYSLARSLITGV